VLKIALRPPAAYSALFAASCEAFSLARLSPSSMTSCLLPHFHTVPSARPNQWPGSAEAWRMRSMYPRSGSPLPLKSL